ncbi:MAG: phage terminase small subunit P27 family [Rhizobiales bacterium]|nr:phage terminase small subunit P27 family [Hyphomicrobiales bacterium]
MRGRKPDQIQSDQDAIANVPAPPAWLSKDGKAEWRRIMPLLVERRILTDADMGSVEAYCTATGLVREMQRTIAREGAIITTERGPRKHPAVAIQADGMNRARLLAAELGLTPVSRSRPSVRDDEDEISALDI